MEFRYIPKTRASSHEDFSYYVRSGECFYKFVDEFNLVGVRWGQPLTISAEYFQRLLIEGSSVRARWRKANGWAGGTDECSIDFQKYYGPLLDHGAMWKRRNGGVICSAMPYGSVAGVQDAFLDMTKEFNYPSSIKMRFLDDSYRFRPNGNLMIIIYHDASEEEFNPNLSEAQLRRKAMLHSAPARYQSYRTTGSFVRDRYVSEYAKRRAHGFCQLCGNRAPFDDENGNPYLEAHHVIWLGDGGDDSIENTVALCPNCHRKMHSLNLEEDVDELLRVARALG